MEPETKRLLEETKALAKDNHQMLRAIRRGQVYGMVWTVLIWAFVIAAPLYIYQQYLRPFIAKFQVESSEKSSGVFGLPSSSQIGNLIDSFKVGQ